MAQSKGIAHGHHPFAHFEFGRVAPLQFGQAAGLDLDHRHIGLGIGTLDFCVKFASVLELDPDLVGAFHYVIVGKNVSFVGQ